MHIAHYFTFFRVLMVPFFSIIYLYSDTFKINPILASYILLFILLVCEFSDIIDGVLAREKDLVSDMGKIIDPMADAIVHLSVFFTFTKGMVSLPLILVFFLLYRELIISALRTLCALRGYALAARKSGKIKAFMQGFCAFFIVFLMIFYNHNFISLRFLQRVSFFLILVAVIYSSATLVDYFYANRKYIKKLLE